jgi:DNA/RNA endonuclease YhcR with UshA esterase domain
MKRIILFTLALLLAICFSCSKEGEQDEIKIKNTEEKSKQPEDQKTSMEKEENVEEETPTKKNVEKSSDYRKKKAPVTIKSTEVKSFVGKYVVVNGYVADVVIRDKVAYLNFERKFPDNPFSAVIFAKHFSDFDDLNEYKNRTVEVRGKVTEYRGKPQIILNSENQVRIVN